MSLLAGRRVSINHTHSIANQSIVRRRIFKMLSFFRNICRFNQCGLEFASLYDLIHHIELDHLVDEEENAKRFNHMQQHGQQTASLVPLSYICKDPSPKSLGSQRPPAPKKSPDSPTIDLEASLRVSNDPCVFFILNGYCELYFIFLYFTQS
uniref:C2H2-type domain-containing protein n=1 Tax=Romanomermis culicivorax TaxID=13658 RepID=A0A915I736_ROMCU